MSHRNSQQTTMGPPAIASAQANAFTTDQALASGVTKRQVAYRLHKGIWCRVAGRALRHCNDPVTPKMLAFAAYLTWPDAILCGPNALALLGERVDHLTDVHVIVAQPQPAQFRLIPHVFKLEARECQRWYGFKITNYQRSVMDALVLLPPEQAQSLFVWLCTRDRLSASDFEEYLERAKGRWGNVKLRRFMADAAAGIMSEAEALVHEILRNANITGWQSNVQVRDEHGIIARADILFPRHKVIIEIDGRAYHGRDRFQEERSRSNRLTQAGYRSLHFTWHDLTKRAGLVVEQVLAVLAARSVR